MLEEMKEISTECQKASFVKQSGTNRHFLGVNRQFRRNDRDKC